jgi:hypothetical protein
MRKNVFLMLFPLILFPFISTVEEPLFQFEFIKYQEEIVIPKDWKKTELGVNMEVFYKYKGEDIVVIGKTEEEDILLIGNLSATKNIYIGMSLFYLNKNGKKLPESKEYVSGFGRSKGSMDVAQFVAFAADAIYSEKFSIGFSGYKELEEDLMKKDVAKIVITLGKCRINCDVSERRIKREKEKISIEWKELMNKDFNFDINKTIEIVVKYDG